jgi:hypothetical protein
MHSPAIAMNSVYGFCCKYFSKLQTNYLTMLQIHFRVLSQCLCACVRYTAATMFERLLHIGLHVCVVSVSSERTSSEHVAI